MFKSLNRITLILASKIKRPPLCPKCGGRGYLEDYWKHYSTFETRIVPCPKCNAEGRLK